MNRFLLTVFIFQFHVSVQSVLPGNGDENERNKQSHQENHSNSKKHLKYRNKKNKRKIKRIAALNDLINLDERSNPRALNIIHPTSTSTFFVPAAAETPILRDDFSGEDSSLAEVDKNEEENKKENFLHLARHEDYLNEDTNLFALSPETEKSFFKDIDNGSMEPCFLESLPNDMLKYICQFLSLKEMMAFSVSNRRLNSIVFDNFEKQDCSLKYISSNAITFISHKMVKLKTLKLSHVSNEDVESVFDNLLDGIKSGCFKHLEWLDISRNKLTGIQILQLMKAIAHDNLPELIALNLSGNIASDNGGYAIVEAIALGKLTKLVYLDISHNYLLERDMRKLVDAISEGNLPHLKHLNIAFNHARGKVIKLLSDAIANKALQHLTILNISGSNADAASLEELAKALEFANLQKFKVLKISNNSANNVFCKILFNAIHIGKLPQLKTIYIKTNKVKAGWIKATLDEFKVSRLNKVKIIY